VPLGRSNLSVSPVCLGTMTFGEQVGQDEAHAILDRALAAGVNFIDTAEMYAVPARAETCGATESIIGEWFARRPGPASRWCWPPRWPAPAATWPGSATVPAT
jgi:aryl-alcohol dehydrogenase-like predicted oxidoreductase